MTTPNFYIMTHLLRQLFNVGKNFKVNFVMLEKYDPSLNNPTTSRFQDMKKLIEQSVSVRKTVLNLTPKSFRIPLTVVLFPILGFQISQSGFQVPLLIWDSVFCFFNSRFHFLYSS